MSFKNETPNTTTTFGADLSGNLDGGDLDLEGTVITDYDPTNDSDLSEPKLTPTQVDCENEGLLIIPVTDNDENSVFPPGTVLDSKSSVVCPVFPTPSEDLSEIEHQGEGMRFKEALDGTLFRLFHFNGQWHLATALSLDIDRVNHRFGHKKTFATMFREALDNTKTVQLSKLDPHYVYLFILQHPENIMIVQHKKPRLVHVATVSISDKAPWYRNHPDMILPGAGQKEVTYPDLETLRKDLGLDQSSSCIPKPCTRVGIIISQQQLDGTVRRWRLNDANYNAAKEYRGRFTDPRYRLLQIICSNKLREDEKELELKRFITVFPNYRAVLKDLDADLERLFQITYAFYVMFFIRKSPTLVFNPETGEQEEKKLPDRELVQGHFVKFLHRIQREVYYLKLQPLRKRMQEEFIADFILVQDPPQVLYLLKGLSVIYETYTPEEYQIVRSYMN